MESDSGSLVVVGIDGSANSRRALEWAIGHSRERGGKVLALLAWEIPIGPWSATGASMDALFASGYDFAGSAREQLDQILGEWLPEDLDVEVESEAREGNAAEVLVTAAVERGAELVVVGSRGLGGFAGLLLGSVSQRCVARAKCPVVVVH